MKTLMIKIATAGFVFVLVNTLSGCSPVFVAQERPHHVIYTAPAPPPQPVAIVPVVPVWAPPYTYVTEVHYYYFPDYMMYYDLCSQNYCYYNNGSWLHVTILPSMPVFYGFNPYSSYVVVLNHSVSQPWSNHNYYEQQYPVEYYRTAYSPRTTLNSNTVLRAYDENQNRPLFVDKRSNREVAVNYTERKASTTDQLNRPANRSTSIQSPVTNRTERNPVINENNSGSVRNNNPQNTVRRITSPEPVKNNPVLNNRSQSRNTIPSVRESETNKRVEAPVISRNNERKQNEIRNIQHVEKTSRGNEPNLNSQSKNQKETQKDSRRR